MPTESPITGLAHLIQISVAPVFLLMGVAGFLGVLTNRLARIIDRRRRLEDNRPAAGAPPEPVQEELRLLRRRARLINRAIWLCTMSALLVAAVIAALFLAAFVDMDLTTGVAAAFVGAMVTLIAGLVNFLREVQLATEWVRKMDRT